MTPAPTPLTIAKLLSLLAQFDLEDEVHLRVHEGRAELMILSADEPHV